MDMVQAPRTILILISSSPSKF